MRHQGRITTWKDDKGFGFITPHGGGEPVFIHIKAFSGRQRRPAEQDLVTYELAADGQGRSQARTVALVGERPSASNPPGRSMLPPVFAAGFLLLVLGMVFTARLPRAVLELYLAASLVAYVAYAWDKAAAQQDQWRTPEKTLHLLALVGGWPGALAAQRRLRHKSVKASFQSKFRITVLLNCGAFGWLLSPSGTKTLNALLGGV